jgi:hypothetical protein
MPYMLYQYIRDKVDSNINNKKFELSNIDDELEHLRNALKMNGYPRHFIDNAMKTPQSIHQKIEYQSSVCLPNIGPASHKIERILRNEAGIKV